MENPRRPDPPVVLGPANDGVGGVGEQRDGATLLGGPNRANGARVRLWKVELQKLANETGLSITVAHHPPGTSKWNRIEHRMFSFISINWRGRPLVSHQVVVQLIASTKTETGLNIACDIDWTRYPKGIKIPKAALKEVNIKYDDFHGDWNYTISPITNQETGKSPSK